MDGLATPVPKASEEFGHVEYLLKLCLRSSRVTDVAVWSVANPHTTVPFERRTAGKLRVDAWVPAADLGEGNTVEEVCRTGFKFPESGGGRAFETGNIDVDAEGSSAAHKFLLCEVGVGRSYVVDNEHMRRDVPAGYDSLYMAPRIDRDRDGSISTEEYSVAAIMAGRPPEAYRHRYIVHDPEQVLPKYIVHFSFSPAEDETAVQCDVCEAETADLHCSRCPANLCEACDQDIHSANKLVARHQRVPLGSLQSRGNVRDRLDALKSRLGDGFAIQSVCPHHPHTQVSYFCRTCFVPVCVDCKMAGSHSTGEFAHHPLTPIVEAYEEALSSSAAVDPMLEARKSAINGRLKALATKLDAVQRNANEVEEEIYNKLQEALLQLKEERRAKVSVLLGEELELRRQLEQMAWTQSFLELQQDALAPAAFLHAWARHSKLMEQMHLSAAELADTSLLDSVKADIKMFGHVVVMSDSEAAAHVLGGQTHSRAADGEGLAAPAIIAGIKNYVRATEAGTAASHGVGFGPVVGGGGAYTTRGGGRRGRTGPAMHGGGGAGGGGAHGGSGGGGQSSLADSMWRSVLQQGMQPAPQPAPPRPARGQASPFSQQKSSSGASRRLNPAEAMPRAPPPPRPVTPAKSAMTAAVRSRTAMYSLRQDARRKQRQRQADMGDPLGAHVFAGSRILSAKDARTLYSCLPLTFLEEEDAAGTITEFATYVQCRLGFATYNNYPATLAEFAREFGDSELNGPTVVVARVGDQVFGGFAADAWDFTGKFGGSTSSFLFSVTKDCKLPYHGRIKGPPQAGDSSDAAMAASPVSRSRDAALLRAAGVDDDEVLRRLDASGASDGGYGGLADDGETKGQERGGRRTDCLRSTPDSLQFGVRDLVFKGDLSECTSELEHSYGVGFRAGSVEAKTFLAGKPVFAVDELEIWCVGVWGEV